MKGGKMSLSPYVKRDSLGLHENSNIFKKKTCNHLTRKSTGSSGLILQHSIIPRISVGMTFFIK